MSDATKTKHLEEEVDRLRRRVAELEQQQNKSNLKEAMQSEELLSVSLDNKNGENHIEQNGEKLHERGEWFRVLSMSAPVGIF